MSELKPNLTQKALKEVLLEGIDVVFSDHREQAKTTGLGGRLRCWTQGWVYGSEQSVPTFTVKDAWSGSDGLYLYTKEHVGTDHSLSIDYRSDTIKIYVHHEKVETEAEALQKFCAEVLPDRNVELIYDCIPRSVREAAERYVEGT